MNILKTAILAFGLMLAPSAAMATPGATAPAAVAANAAAPADAVANAAAPVWPVTPPVAGIGQPVNGAIGIQPQVTKLGEEALWMHDIILMPVMVIISLLVLGLLFWIAARYRAKANPIASKTSHNTAIEVIWTLLPVLILVGIAIPSISLLAKQYKPAPKEAITLKATGNQWNWSYEYPDHGIEFTANMLPEKDEAAPGTAFRTDADGPRLLAADNRIILPVGVPIKLLTTASDVIHSWAMPAFWIKMDAVPGRTNETSFTIEKPGVYFGQCSELCGDKHAYMPIVVEAVSPARFAEWVKFKGGKMPGSEPVAAAVAPAAPAATGATAPVADNAAAPAANATNAATAATGN
ncbi:cytochrome c oxidase subunit II [Sphingobium boeckii]|uniref:Cytochrome c oxidase subunit 2 n=1 Tax=Sphingobium boeckii TaxID=1082345 RepID=A0A7W9AEN8_9SPHN|nr:cytochrome c oxidase subunit II [Sphingobium boeckii]MBB5684193.1 cytochrome c oxidase subunit 2 [Sphingobium boeckii]